MHEAVDLVALLAVAAAAAGIANRIGVSAPLLLTALGLVLSVIPGVPVFPLQPEVVLIGLLPPLLYATAIRTPWVDLRRNSRAIALLSVGLVLVTAFAVAAVVHALLPSVPFATALALGAVVAPPDAVAASAVARRIGMPRQLVALLEGESLLNDATALVTLRTALAAVAGSVSVLQAGGNFVLAVLGGVLTGWLAAAGASFVRRWVEDPVLDISLSLLVPFVCYLVAEAVHGSGVIAVVVAGLILGHRSTRVQSAESRVTERIIFRTVQFLLESVVFLLLGLQFSDLVRAAHANATGDAQIVLICLGVLLTVIVVRIVWVFPATYLPRVLPRIRAEPVPSPNQVALVSWAGMRGVVTLAAALTIPASVPDRDILVVAAFTVVIGTLLLQGTTLPWLVRRLGVRGPDPVQDALQQALLQHQAAQAALTRLDEDATAADAPHIVTELRDWGERLANSAWERLGGEAGGNGRQLPAVSFLRLRLSMLDAERQVVVGARSNGSVPNEIAERVLERVDQEEALMSGFTASVGASPEDQPPVRVPAETSCQHLRAAWGPVSPDSRPDVCPDCLALGEHDWVHLRMCESCGHVGCCDSSPRRHADEHYSGTGHPVMRSIELGEFWRWCYVDSELG